MQHCKEILLQFKKINETLVASEAREDGKNRQESLAWPALGSLGVWIATPVGLPENTGGPLLTLQARLWLCGWTNH